MEQNCDLCKKLFESTEIWAVSNKSKVELKSYCDDCVDEKIHELSRTEFDALLEINNYQSSDYRHQYG